MLRGTEVGRPLPVCRSAQRAAGRQRCALAVGQERTLALLDWGLRNARQLTMRQGR